MFFRLGVDTGARQQELAKIKVGDINRHGTRIRMMGKGARERDLVLSQSMQRELRSYLRTRAEMLEESGMDDEEVPWLFPTLRGSRLRSTTIQRFLKRMSEAGGVTPSDPVPRPPALVGHRQDSAGRGSPTPP